MLRNVNYGYHRIGAKRSALNGPRQHTPHRLRRLPLGGTGDMGVGIESEACGEVAQHPGHRFHIYPVLQG